MECTDRPVQDYQAAAERLLVTLSWIAGKKKNHPTLSKVLCAHIFDHETRRHWQHETKRRVVRKVAAIARGLLIQRGHSGEKGVNIVADGRGYWLSGDPQVLSWYAAQRRDRGLREIIFARDSAAAIEHARQKNLFPDPPPPASPTAHVKSQFRH